MVKIYIFTVNKKLPSLSSFCIKSMPLKELSALLPDDIFEHS